MAIVTSLLTPLMTTHEPPSGVAGFRDLGVGFRVWGLGSSLY